MDAKKIITRSIKWKIHNFTKDLAVDGKSISSSSFEIPYDNKVTEWCFIAHIQDNRLFVNPSGNSVKDCTIHSYSAKLYNHKLKDKFFFPTSLLLDTVFVNPHHFLKDHTLTVLIEAEFVDGLESVVSESNHLPIFKNFFNNESLRDFTFYCSDGAKIKAHRLVLFAASSGLKRLVEYGSTSIRMNDIDGHTMTEILRYIYTDDIFGMKSNYENLMYGAEKFGLEGLKIRCAKYLVKYLSANIAVYCFILADKYNMNYMLHRTARFIKSNQKDIAETWLNLKILDKRQSTKLEEYCSKIPQKILLFESSLVKQESTDREE